MADRYISPEVRILYFASSEMLCQSQVQSGTVEDVGRLEFDW